MGSGASPKSDMFGPDFIQLEPSLLRGSGDTEENQSLLQEDRNSVNVTKEDVEHGAPGHKAEVGPCGDWVEGSARQCYLCWDSVVGMAEPQGRSGWGHVPDSVSSHQHRAL